jgi:hypothetical protein
MLRFATSTLIAICLAAVTVVIGPGTPARQARASDHYDSPASLGNQAADITDFFAFPIAPAEGGGPRLVLMMTLHPYALPFKEAAKDKYGVPARQFGTQFSDAVDYQFHLRPASITGSKSSMRVETGGKELVLTCTFFDTIGADKHSVFQAMKCTAKTITLNDDGRPPESDTGATFTTQVELEDTSGGKHEHLKVFAGCRADPFFADALRVNMDQPRSKAKDWTGVPVTLPVAKSNVLAIVAVIDLDVLLGKRDRPLLAAVARTSKGRMRIDRMGRPLSNNFLIGKHDVIFDTSPILKSMRDHWNRQDPFDLDPAIRGDLTDAMRAGLRRLDEFDGKEETELDWDYPRHQFLDILLHDYLVIDPSHPVSPSNEKPTFLEIEKAHYAKGRGHNTCGGRTPNDDIVDTVLTWFINGPERETPHRGDGIDANYPLVKPGRASDTFPYLAPPHSDPPAKR